MFLINKLFYIFKSIKLYYNTNIYNKIKMFQFDEIYENNDENISNINESIKPLIKGRKTRTKQVKLKYNVRLYDIISKTYINLGQFSTFENISEYIEKYHNLTLPAYKLKYISNKQDNKNLLSVFIQIESI